MPPLPSPRPPRGRTAHRLTRLGNPRFSIGGGTKATVRRRLHEALRGRSGSCRSVEPVLRLRIAALRRVSLGRSQGAQAVGGCCRRCRQGVPNRLSGGRGSASLRDGGTEHGPWGPGAQNPTRHLTSRRQWAHPCVAHDGSAVPAGRLRRGVQLADDQGAAAVGLHDLHLQAVTGADGVGGAQRGGMTPACIATRELPRGAAPSTPTWRWRTRPSAATVDRQTVCFLTGCRPGSSLA
jgi:hypothetical protein